jgi:hypothetical protein
MRDLRGEIAIARSFNPVRGGGIKTRDRVEDRRLAARALDIRLRPWVFRPGIGLSIEALFARIDNCLAKVLFETTTGRFF